MQDGWDLASPFLASEGHEWRQEGPQPRLEVVAGALDSQAAGDRLGRTSRGRLLEARRVSREVEGLEASEVAVGGRHPHLPDMGGMVRLRVSGGWSVGQDT
ncbi:hypothetical protein NDU88_004931 [Pleurodeles waltl]|uniref:Uncharacterized protein n=1 Tax=Pleurodeles waltl TaxID=8319 RepID=A0AAV7TSU4_PLEWA|nr:hypothetical protein NDU88_004931 [Pleurodeles waltl]